MRNRRLGENGPSVPVVGQGTWHMERDDHASAVSALRAGIDAGAIHIDTAEMYGSGAVERLVGEALVGRRGEVFLVSKVLPTHASRTGTVLACERSLRRLGTDHLDVYLLHWSGEHPLEATIGAFEQLAADGKIRRWGVSNFDVPELEAALEIAGPGKIACNQVLYHLGERAVEHDVLPWCQEHGVAVVAYSPFGSGAFPGPESAGGRVLTRIADERNATAHQIALAFLLREAGTFVIPKAADPSHALSNAAAADVMLIDEHVKALNDAFPRGPVRPLPML